MAVNNRLYVDFHILQTVPPSCVNRDDTGSPKTAVYGGTVRARVSSQAWKRAMRLMFRELFDESALGKRTKRVLQQCDPDAGRGNRGKRCRKNGSRGAEESRHQDK